MPAAPRPPKRNPPHLSRRVISIRLKTLTTSVIQPGEFELKGIYLLSRDRLLALDGVLDEAEREFSRYANRKLNEAVNKRLHEWSLNPEKDKESVKRDIKSRYPFTVKTRLIELHCISEKKFTGKTFGDIIADPQIKNEKPLYATVTIRNGDAELKIKLLGEFFVNKIGVSISPNRSFTQRVIRQVRDWAEDNRRLDWYRKFAMPLGSIGFGLVTLAVMLMPVGMFATISNKSDIINNARTMIADGLSESEVPQAVETLLKFHINDFTTITRIDIKSWFIALVIVAFGLLLFGILCPKSTIGVGLQEKRLKRIEFFTGKIWLWISAWLFAVITSALGSVLIDLFSNDS